MILNATIPLLFNLHKIPSVTVAIATYSGGFGIANIGNKRRTKAEIQEAREKDGIITKDIIDAIALRQSEDLHLDKQQQLEELERELKLVGIEFKSKHIKMLNIQRELYINNEISRLLKLKFNLEQQDIQILLLIASCS